MTGNISILAGTLILAAGLVASGSSVAKERMTGVAGRDNSCQRTQRTIDSSDYAAVCCRITAGSRSKHVRTNRKKCLERGGAIVRRSLCPRRPRSRGEGSWVCCETDTTPGLGARIVGGKKVSRALMPASRCRKRDNSKIIARHHCVKKRSRRDRMLECRQKGKGWVWKNSRCVRENLRDRRNR